MEDYNLEIDKILELIKKKNYKRIMIQLPDGLQPKSKEIADKIANFSDVEVIIWAGNCFGACDIPNGLEQFKIDLYIQWGHNLFIKKDSW